MPTINIYATLTNIANKVSNLREMYRQLEALEEGTAIIGDESITIPAGKLTEIKGKLTTARTKVEKLAKALKVEIKYN